MRKSLATVLSLLVLMEGRAVAQPTESPKPGIFEPPQDVEQPDTSLPPGTISVDLRDADDRPVPNETVVLGEMVSSVAKGDSRKHLQVTTDGLGRSVFTGLETASNVAYRVSAGYQGGAFAASPFRLDQATAMHVVLHVYPVVRDLRLTPVVTEATVAAEVRDDRIQMEEVLTFYNLGRTAWQPTDVRFSLPDGFKAFTSPAAMSDQGVDEVDGSAKLRGTFLPGRNSVQFQWQIPWSGDRDVDFDVGLPPRVALARVVMPVSAEISLVVDAFPAAQVRRDAQGRKFLVTERRLRPEDPQLTALAVGIHGLPTAGPGRLLATMFSAAGVAAGLALAFGRRTTFTKPPLVKGPAAARAGLLEAFAELEEARHAGEVGPKTYERERRRLLDALAHTMG